jgi:hypothetical protein
MDCETFEILGRYEMDRGEQDKHYDFWWNLPRDYMVSSEWGLPPQFENGIVPRTCCRTSTATRSISGTCASASNVQTIDLGENHQMALEIRPAHDPAKEYGFCGVVVDTTNLQGAIFTWWRKDDGTFEAKKTITIDPRPREGGEPAAASAGLRGRAAAGHRHRPQPRRQVPLRRLLGQGEMHQYDVSDPMNPKLAGKVEIGGIVKKHQTSQRQGPSATARRWSRSAATASASTGPTRSIRPGTTSSIPGDEGGDGHGQCRRNGGLSWTRISTSSSRKAIAATRSGWRAATVRPTASATRPSDALVEFKRQRPFGSAVVASGIYHGVNPGMGWPLAVSAALFEGQRTALLRALAALGFGHLLAMLGILLPFAVMFVLVEYQREIRIGASCLVIAAGLYLVFNRRHPRFLSRVKPTRLALWSFLVAMAHGAGLMLVPI